MTARRLVAMAAVVGGLVACTSSGAEPSPTLLLPPSSLPSTTAPLPSSSTEMPAATSPSGTDSVAISSAPVSTSTPSSATEDVTTVTISAAAATTAPAAAEATTTSAAPTTTPYGMPVRDGAHAGYSHQHHDYPASDVFVPGSCGSEIVSPVNGVILEARRDDTWNASTDNPATRGGKSIAILGDDGVRYYLAHFFALADDIAPGVRVELGHLLGNMGRTGKAGACHVHFAISPPCPGKEWAVRRGVIWPWRYLDAWKRGEQLSPLPEVMQWVADHPTACADAMADPDAPLS